MNKWVMLSILAVTSGLTLLAFQNQAYPEVAATFAVVGDPHYGYSEDRMENHDHEDEDDHDPSESSDSTFKIPTREWNRQFIKAAFSLSLPEYRQVLTSHSYHPDVLGLVVLGDLTNSGSLNQWQQFRRDFGLHGGDGYSNPPNHPGLPFPVYEIAGNHDYPSIEDNGGSATPPTSGSQLPVIKGVINRNKSRKNLIFADPNGGHYAWEWKGITFISLGLKASDKENSVIKKRGAAYRVTPPFKSLQFLNDVLKSRPHGTFVISMHYSPTKSLSRFNKAERIALRETIKGYKIAALLHAHQHSTSTSKWCGVPVFNIGGPLMNYGNHSLGNPPKANAYAAFAVLSIKRDRLRAMTVGYKPDMSQPNLPTKLKFGNDMELQSRSQTWAHSLDLLRHFEEQRRSSDNCATTVPTPL